MTIAYNDLLGAIESFKNGVDIIEIARAYDVKVKLLRKAIVDEVGLDEFQNMSKAILEIEYEKEDILKAIESIKSGIEISEVASTYGINKRLLRKAIVDEVGRDGFQNIRRLMLENQEPIQYEKEDILKVIERIQSGVPLDRVASTHGVHTEQLRQAIITEVGRKEFRNIRRAMRMNMKPVRHKKAACRQCEFFRRMMCENNGMKIDFRYGFTCPLSKW